MIKQKQEVEPRGQCLYYVAKNGGNAVLVDKTEFDKLAKMKGFTDGPYRDNFGDNPGEPYNPRRQAFGKLEDGKIIFCELSSV